MKTYTKSADYRIQEIIKRRSGLEREGGEGGKADVVLVYVVSTYSVMPFFLSLFLSPPRPLLLFLPGRVATVS